MKENYVNPNDLTFCLQQYKDTGVASDELGILWMTMCDRILTRNNFRGYNAELKQDMKSHALVLLMRYAKNCDIAKRTPRQVFNYISTCIINAFKQVLNDHYAQINLKNELYQKQKRDYNPKR